MGEFGIALPKGWRTMLPQAATVEWTHPCTAAGVLFQTLGANNDSVQEIEREAPFPNGIEVPEWSF
jgi:hypothetical protein